MTFERGGLGWRVPLSRRDPCGRGGPCRSYRRKRNLKKLNKNIRILSQNISLLFLKYTLK